MLKGIILAFRNTEGFNTYLQLTKLNVKHSTMIKRNNLPTLQILLKFPIV